MGRGPYGKTKMQVFVTGASGFIPQVRVAISRLIERIKATPRQPGVEWRIFRAVGSKNSIQSDSRGQAESEVVQELGYQGWRSVPGVASFTP